MRLGPSVCAGHNSPLDWLVSQVYDRPPLSLEIGPRGGGKSFIAGLATHLDSQRYDRHGTKILGGSLAQSQQIYGALKEFDRLRPGAFTAINRESAQYRTGSEVSILAASPKSVRGPHVATLRLDEVDEISDDLRESAMGMCMTKDGVSPSVSMTSTWHRVGGPMAGLVEQAEAGRFPLFRFCLFEVLETCPESRSGPGLEKCPACPLMQWCHTDAGPKAKQSCGHYTIDAACQKVVAVSLRIFEADYLCLGPRADGIWFPQFAEATHVSIAAEYEPGLPVLLAIDNGVFTGAVFLQVVGKDSRNPVVHVFADYLTESQTAQANAAGLIELAGKVCCSVIHRVVTDPAGGARNAVGPTVIAEYERAGLRPMERWPLGSVADGLALVDSFVTPADGTARLIVHPRCTATIRALRAYRRAKRAGQWQEYPEDPQHPSEDLVDALRGGLRSLWPAGRTPDPGFRTMPARRVI